MRCCCLNLSLQAAWPQEIAPDCLQLLLALEDAFADFSSAVGRALRQQQQQQQQQRQQTDSARQHTQHAQRLVSFWKLHQLSNALSLAVASLLNLMQKPEVRCPLDKQQLLSTLGQLVRRVC